MKKLIIGIVGGVHSGKFADLLYTKETYIKTITKERQVPITLPITKDKSVIDSLIRKVDGIIFTGGVNIYPFHYGENPKTEYLEYDLERDYSEFLYLETALKYKKTVLGISRGCQLINVYMGGSLTQDIKKENLSDIYHMGEKDFLETMHYINIVEGTKIERAFGKSRAIVVSCHNQCIKNLGKDLKISARSDDEIIEAIEYTKDSYLVGVQFNLDRMNSKESQGLFSQFIERAGIYNE
ncbi:gamma-glutamyl-gamma-aminobutyrate hydrolase family protein [Peptostreptococcaceae bacterium OttesenSCG-928-C18]|nr:gamma-glutamyl-gamma-aminobutyrate hydrolase family protein [Peptostreptococcaceae bacterium OttesenSCG-928-C18]